MKPFNGMVVRKWFSLIIFLFLAMPLIYPQQGNADGAAKKKEEVRKAHKKAYENARKWTLKHRRAIQTPETRKRMDAADRRADAYNRQNEKKWWEKIFQKHPRKY
jgi:hypothetical protein